MSLYELQGSIAYDLARLEMAEHQREGARQRLARLARPESRWEVAADDARAARRFRLRLSWRRAAASPSV
jgi:hypothetical protein